MLVSTVCVPTSLSKSGYSDRVPRGSSKLVSLASQLTKPLKVKRLFPSLVCFLNPSPEAPRGIDLKWENMISILIITNLICWLPVCRKTDWLCYEFLGGKQFCCWNQFPRASYLPSSGRIRNQFKSKLRATPQKWAIELMSIYLVLLVVLLRIK